MLPLVEFEMTGLGYIFPNFRALKPTLKTHETISNVIILKVKKACMHALKFRTRLHQVYSF